MPEREHWLAGRVAVVTGASCGIGRATALAIARAGAHTVVAATSAQALAETVAAILDAGGAATAVPTDVANAADVAQLFRVASGIGPPVALVCAAATLQSEPFDEISLASWERTISVNLTGVFNCCREAFTLMRAAGEGRIVNIASLSGIYATEKFPGLAAYNASKGGVIGLTEGIAVEGKPFGITAISVKSRRRGHPDAPRGQPDAPCNPWARRRCDDDRRLARQPARCRQRRQHPALLERVRSPMP